MSGEFKPLGDSIKAISSFSSDQDGLVRIGVKVPTEEGSLSGVSIFVPVPIDRTVVWRELKLLSKVFLPRMRRSMNAESLLGLYLDATLPNFSGSSICLRAVENCRGPVLAFFKMPRWKVFLKPFKRFGVSKVTDTLQVSPAIIPRFLLEDIFPENLCKLQDVRVCILMYGEAPASIPYISTTHSVTIVVLSVLSVQVLSWIAPYIRCRCSVVCSFCVPQQLEWFVHGRFPAVVTLRVGIILESLGFL